MAKAYFGMVEQNGLLKVHPDLFLKHADAWENFSCLSTAGPELQSGKY